MLERNTSKGTRENRGVLLAKGSERQTNDIAEKHDLNQVRISGNEPTMGKNHLLPVLEKMDESRLKFILETNGILLGNDPEYVESLKKFDDLYVGVSLKGFSVGGRIEVKLSRG